MRRQTGTARSLNRIGQSHAADVDVRVSLVEAAGAAKPHLIMCVDCVDCHGAGNVGQRSLAPAFTVNTCTQNHIAINLDKPPHSSPTCRPRYTQAIHQRGSAVYPRISGR